MKIFNNKFNLWKLLPTQFFQWSEASDLTMISASGGTYAVGCVHQLHDILISPVIGESASCYLPVPVTAEEKEKKNCALQRSKNGVNIMCRTQLSSRKWWVGQGQFWASTLEYQWLETADADLPTVVSRSIAKSHAFACRRVGWSHPPFPGT